MPCLEELAEQAHNAFEARTAARDHLLAQARTLTRFCANAIRAAHREEQQQAAEFLTQARHIVELFKTTQIEYPDLYYAGYTQDALKEYAEANIVFALLDGKVLPTADDLGLQYAGYLQGLAEAVGELRRRALDMLLKGNTEEAQRMLAHMDDIYSLLVTMDYPDAITGGLRRLTDIARSIIERTRGDLTISLRQENLEQSLRHLEKQLQQIEAKG